METLSMDMHTTALVVIDLQKGIVARDVAPHTSEEVIKNAAALADAFRAKGAPVFLVRVTSSPDGKDALHPDSDAVMPRRAFAPDWAEIVPAIGPKEGDFIITKHQWGAFYGTDLELQLRRRGIRTIVLCGISTNIGVESTARFAYEYGFQQVFAEDAMAAFSTEDHAAPVSKTFPRIGRVRLTAEILAAVNAA
ncbi:MAG: hydrolase [Patescibacteria group bacterium]|nr:hydrolase [Patescibacteria group bacterium]